MMDCMKFFFFCREFIGQDWLKSCGDNKCFYETQTLLRPAKLFTADCNMIELFILIRN